MTVLIQTNVYMLERFKDHTEGAQMQKLLEEAQKILVNSSDLNRDKSKLGRLLDEIMHWTKEGEQEFEKYYSDFCNTITAMIELDFTRTLPEPYSKTIFSFMTLGLNILNEELFGKIISTKMLRCILDSLDLKNTALILTNAIGQITFVHSRVKNIFVGEDYLVGQPMSVIIEDFDTLDKKFKSAGLAKGIEVKIKFGNETEQIVMLNIAIPSILSKSEGVAYILTLSDKQIASINRFNKISEEKNILGDLSNFENNCSKFELTVKEKEIALLLVKGFTQDEIAHNFSRSSHTVRKHIQNIRVKFGAKNKRELISSLTSSTF